MIHDTYAVGAAKIEVKGMGHIEGLLAKVAAVLEAGVVERPGLEVLAARNGAQAVHEKGGAATASALAPAC